jgi:predicted RNase H-like HicB family nuclease
VPRAPRFIDIWTIHDIIKTKLRERRHMLTEYIQKALEKAQYKVLEDGTWFAEIPGFQGVWANAGTVEECRHELVEVLEEWLVLKIRDKDPIPEIEGASIRIKEIVAA